MLIMNENSLKQLQEPSVSANEESDFEIVPQEPDDEMDLWDEKNENEDAKKEEYIRSMFNC